MIFCEIVSEFTKWPKAHYSRNQVALIWSCLIDNHTASFYEILYGVYYLSKTKRRSINFLNFIGLNENHTLI